jgi:HEAT repeat protein
MHAFTLLGPGVQPALPELFRLMNDSSATNASERAALALAFIGKDALPLFLTQIANTNAPHRADAIVLIKMCDDLTTDAGPTLPMLIQCLIDNDTNVVKEAALVLREYDLKPGLIMPALTNCLGTSTNSLLRSRVFWVLGQIGDHASPAKPFLVAALKDPNASVRKQATNSLLQIAPEALTNAAQ